MFPVLINILQRNRTNRTNYIYAESEKEKRQRESERRDFKELVHMIWGTGKFKICKAGQHAGHSGKS